MYMRERKEQPTTWDRFLFYDAFILFSYNKTAQLDIRKMAKKQHLPKNKGITHHRRIQCQQRLLGEGVESPLSLDISVFQIGGLPNSVIKGTRTSVIEYLFGQI